MKCCGCAICHNFDRILPFLLCLLLTLLTFSEARSQESPLTPLLGTWQVKGVRLDVTLSSTPNYNYDDPRLIGRLITITPEEIRADTPEDTICTLPIAKLETSTIGTLVSGTMSRGKKRSEKEISNKFELPVGGEKEIQVWWVGCKDGDMGPDTPFGPEGLNWVTMVAKDQLAIRWYDNTILLLNRLPPNPKPQPSFQCERSKKPAEKEICSSLSLSELDQSVSRLFSVIAKERREHGELQQLKKLQSAQKGWINKRNKCARDVNCLKNSMQERLEELAPKY